MRTPRWIRLRAFRFTTFLSLLWLWPLWLVVVSFSVCIVATPLWASGDRGADGDYDERKSSHFTLYQDVDIDRTSGFYGSRRFEQQVLEALEAAYRMLDATLGIRPRETITVTIHDSAVFDRRFAGLFRFPAAGFYGGTIHIRGETMVSDRLIRVLHHELVHAAFDSALPNTMLPAWFNEGVAEWFEARAVGQHKLPDRLAQVLTQRARADQLFALSEMSAPSLGGLPPRAAQLAYLESYGFVDFLVRERGERRLRDLCRRLVRTGELGESLRRIFRDDLAGLEVAFVAALFGAAH